MTFARFAICVAYYAYAAHRNVGGETASPYNGRPIFARLHRIGYQAGPMTLAHLEEDLNAAIPCDDYARAVEIYRSLEAATR